MTIIQTASDVWAEAQANATSIVEQRRARRAGTASATAATTATDDTMGDPADYTVDEVVTYARAHPDEVTRLVMMEQEGKNRSTLLDQLAQIN